MANLTVHHRGPRGKGMSAHVPELLSELSHRGSTAPHKACIWRYTFNTQGATVQQTAPSSESEILPSDPEILRDLSAGIASTCAGFNLRRASRAVTQHFDHA